MQAFRESSILSTSTKQVPRIPRTSMLDIFLFLLLLSGSFATLIGLVTIVFVFVKGKKDPMDSSNRINHIRLWWFVLSRPELFTKEFPWLKNDELDNMK